MTIVCATHFTHSSRAAQRVAVALASARQQRLLIVNVSEDLPPSVRRRADTGFAAFDAVEREVRDVDPRCAGVRSAALTGAFGPTLWRFCSEHAASLLIIGDSNHLTSALERNALDEVADEVGMPILVVRDEAPLLSWLRGGPPLRVMLAVDRGPAADRVLAWVHALAGYGAVSIVVVHVWSPRDEYARRGLEATDVDDAHQRMATTVRRDFGPTLANLPPGGTSRLHLEIGRAHVADQLLDASVAEQVDLLVVATHPSANALSRLGSVSRNVLELAPMSVVCVPEPRAAAAPLPPWAEGPARRTGRAT